MIAPKSASTPFKSPVAPRGSWRESLEVYLQRRVLIVLLLGFSAGLPLALSGSTLLVWMRESGIDLGIIGLFAQGLLIVAIVPLGLCNPATVPWYVVLGGALLAATASATQDIAIDAFRIESL